MLSINTNISSLIAQSSMKTSSQLLNQAVERMSTGYKINHAKDNAANYSISTNMTTKMGALQVAEDNALQGLEMMSSTSENLSLIEEKLVRMRALAVQAQSGTYGSQSLNALSVEADSLLNEINRINESATYNGIKLFNTGKDNSVTNAGKELKLNEQGFLQEVVKVDTTGMTALGSMADDATLAVGEYTISSKEELVQLKEMSDDGLLEAGSTFVLTKDIDMSGVTGWNGIGATNAFRGIFEGNGYTISNLSGTQGLFSSVSRHSDAIRWSEIKNVRLENVRVLGTSVSRGAICGSGSHGKISNCSVVNGIVEGGNYTAGILGQGYYLYTKYCYFEGSVTGKNYIGGITGYNNYSETTNSISVGTISGNSSVGGIVGNGSVLVCKAFATVKGVTNVGGISGGRDGNDSYFNGIVKGETKVGGISANGSNTNCIVEGSVSGTTDVGIFSGGTSVTIQDSYYYGKSLSKLSATADDTTSTVSNITDITIPCDYTLQIASSGDDATSTISCTTYIDFGGLKDLLSSGLENASSIEKIDNLISIASLKQAELGMMEQRLYSVLDEISIQYENLVSSRSTILDADIADVSSTYIQQQILQQASATLMSTANQSPAIALQLI